MGLGKGMAWLFLRNTTVGKKILGQETDAERAAREIRLGQVATRAYEKSLAQKGRDLQYVDGEVRVEVRNGYDYSHRCYVTDILIFPRDGSGDRYHVIIDADGNELYSGYHQH